MPNALPILLLGGAALFVMGGKKGGGGRGVADAPVGSGDVVVYTATWCGACQFLKGDLEEAGIPFSEKDVDTDAEAAEFVKSKGGMIPVTTVNGKVFVGGSNLAAIKAARAAG